MKCHRWPLGVSLVIIVVLVVLVSLYGTGVLGARSTQLALKQTWEAVHPTHRVSGPLVAGGPWIAWLGTEEVHVARVDGQSISKEPARSLRWSSSEMTTAPTGLALEAVTGDRLLMHTRDSVSYSRWESEGGRWQLQHTWSFPDTRSAGFDPLSIDRLVVVGGDAIRLVSPRQPTVSIPWPESASSLAGKQMVQAPGLVVVADPAAHGQQGRVYVISTGLGKVTQVIDSSGGSSERLGFGTTICLDHSGTRLFVSYSEHEERIDYLVRTPPGPFRHVQTLTNRNPAHTVAFPRFGAAMACHDRLLAIACPGSSDDQFSHLQLYPFDRFNRASSHPQQVAVDQGGLGETLLFLGPATLVAAHPQGGAHGQLLLFNNRG